MSDMSFKIERLLSAMGEIDTGYLEEALHDIPRGSRRAAPRKGAARFPKISAACAVLLVLSALFTTAFAVGTLPSLWSRLFGAEQTVIGEGDESPVTSAPTTGSAITVNPAATQGTW